MTPFPANYTWAYDGSGVALRAPVEVLAESSDTEVVVRFVGTVPPVDRLTERVLTDDTRVVKSAALTPVGSYAPLASFNFLD